MSHQNYDHTEQFKDEQEIAEKMDESLQRSVAASERLQESQKRVEVLQAKLRELRASKGTGLTAASDVKLVKIIESAAQNAETDKEKSRSEVAKVEKIIQSITVKIERGIACTEGKIAAIDQVSVTWKDHPDLDNSFKAEVQAEKLVQQTRLRKVQGILSSGLQALKFIGEVVTGLVSTAAGIATIVDFLKGIGILR